MVTKKNTLKKTLIMSIGLGITIPLASPSVFAEESTLLNKEKSASSEYVYNASLDNSRVLYSMGVEEDTVISEEDEDPDGELGGMSGMGGSIGTPDRGDVSTQATSVWWETTKKEYKGVKYGSYKTLVERSSGQGGSITITFTKTRANSYTGELKVPKTKMDAYVGFDIKRETSVSVNDAHTGLKKNKTYLAQYRTRNKVYEVTQQRVTLENWTGKITRGEKKVLTVKKQDGYNTRVAEK